MNYMLAPIYFLFSHAKLSQTEAIAFVENAPGLNYTKQKLVERLSSTDDQSRVISDTGSPASTIMLSYRNQLLNGSITKNIPIIEIGYACEAIRSLDANEADLHYLRALMKNWFDDFYSYNGNTKSKFRRAVCHLDVLFYRDHI